MNCRTDNVLVLCCLRQFGFTKRDCTACHDMLCASVITTDYLKYTFYRHAVKVIKTKL